MTAIFPSVIMPSWSVTKSPRFATRIQQSVSGRELRMLDQPYPLWTFTLTWERLRSVYDARGPNNAAVDIETLRTILGFWLAMQGPFQPFLFDDPTDDYITGQYIGTGNGTQTAWQLVRTPQGYGSTVYFPEPITEINQTVPFNVYLNGILQVPSSSYSITPGVGTLTFATSPPNGAIITVDFGYYFLCRFLGDDISLENFAYRLWSLKELKFTSIFT